MYVRGYLQGSENGRVVTIDGRLHYDRKFQIFIFLIRHNNVNKGVFCFAIYKNTTIITYCLYVIKLKTLWKFVEAWFIFIYLKDMLIKSVTLELTLVILISTTKK
jgi:hypothetical protein